jgi:hypothetical protein
MKDSKSGFTPHAKPRTDDANAFLPDPEDGPAHTSDDLAESLAENFVQGATTGESPDEQAMDATVSEEIGGPFIETDVDEEVAFDEDGSNPPDAEPAGLPTAVRGLAAEPRIDRDLDRATAGADAGDEEDDDDDDDDAVEPAAVEAADMVKGAAARESA